MEEKLKQPAPSFKEIIDLIETLRGENGCPWDKKQTPLSMARNLVEEVFELMDAIQSDNIENVCEELSDVLFLVLFIAVQYQTSGLFDINTLAQRNLDMAVIPLLNLMGRQRREQLRELRYVPTTVLCAGS